MESQSVYSLEKLRRLSDKSLILFGLRNKDVSHRVLEILYFRAEMRRLKKQRKEISKEIFQLQVEIHEDFIMLEKYPGKGIFEY